MQQTVKTLAPICGGLLMGNGISDMIYGNVISGAIQTVVGLALIVYTLYLILR